MIGKKIAVILGAGASYDLITPRQGNSIINSNFRPPLTPNLFTLPRELEGILNQYVKAYTAIGTMKNRFGQKNFTLEGLLRDLKDSNEESDISQYKQIPLYLQDIFGRISTNYCDHPMNYATLVSQTRRSNISEVAYITTNYDLFMEQALSREYDQIFNTVQDYIPINSKWQYIKLHGSINWVRKIKDSKITNPGENLAALLDNVEHINLESDLETDISIDSSYVSRPAYSNKVYPVLTVPVDNKYEFSCPKIHVEKLQEFLHDCKNFLIIGVSGKDKDLLNLLNQHCINATFVTIVGGSHVVEAKENFQNSVKKFNTASWVADFNQGFSDFISRDGISSFLNNAIF